MSSALLYTRPSFTNSDSSSQYYSIQTDSDMNAMNAFLAYDMAASKDRHRKLVESLRRLEGLCEPPPPSPMPFLERKVSFVDHWRHDVKIVNSDPPMSPCVADLPSSPVALVHPAMLRVTSRPPYDVIPPSSEEEDLPWSQDDDEDTLDSASDGLGDRVIIPNVILAPPPPPKKKTRPLRWLMNLLTRRH